jgi:putative peptidoglycan lipid II flippase
MTERPAQHASSQAPAAEPGAQVGGAGAPVDRRTWAALGRSALLVGAGTVIAKLLGFIEKQALAYFFGTGAEAQAYLVMTSALAAVAVTARELTEPVLLPRFVASLSSSSSSSSSSAAAASAAEQRGPRAGWHLVRRFWRWASALAALAAAASAQWPAVVVRFLAPGLAPAAADAAARLLQLSALAMVLLAAASVTEVALNGRRRFGRPVLADLGYRAVLIAGCCLAATSVGPAAFACAAVAGAAAKVLLHVTALPREALRRARGAAPAAAPVPAGASGIWLIAVGIVLGQVSALAETHVASLVGGDAVAGRLYARKIVDLPVLLAPYVLSVVVFPTLSLAAAGRDRQAVPRLVAPLVRWTIALFVPLAVAVAVFGDQIVCVLLGRGRFDLQACTSTGAVLSVYAAGLPAFALDAVLVPVFFAARDTRRPVLVGMLGVAINLGAMALLFRPWGVAGIAAALVLAKTVKVLVLHLLLARRHGALGLDLLRAVAPSLLAAPFALATALLVRWLMPVPVLGLLPGAWSLARALAPTFAVFAAAWWLLLLALRPRAARL